MRFMENFNLRLSDAHWDQQPSTFLFSRLMTPSPPPRGGEGRGEGGLSMGSFHIVSIQVWFLVESTPFSDGD